MAFCFVYSMVQRTNSPSLSYYIPELLRSQRTTWQTQKGLLRGYQGRFRDGESLVIVLSLLRPNS